MSSTSASTGRQTTTRALHDLGAAIWLGGSLMGAVGLNGASKAVTDPTDRSPVATAGWARWSPVNAAAIGAHLLGGAGLLIGNAHRVADQPDVKTNTTAKLAVTAAALGATAWSGALGAKLGKAGKVPATSGVQPSPETPVDAAKAMRQLRVLQWVIPALTAVIVVLTSQQGEQQSAPAPSGLGGLRGLAAPLVGVLGGHR